ncbi:probable non-ribosomal peptide synthetase [gamma proteobacterium HdN1]|nr:probable non-ribosomal peptide synthetase [gamma proteobacterium HdN1]
MQASSGGGVQENDIAALRGLLQALGLTTNTHGAAVGDEFANKLQGIPALLIPDTQAYGKMLRLPVSGCDLGVLRHKAGAWLSSFLGVGATLFALLSARYQSRGLWLEELSAGIGQCGVADDVPLAWFSLSSMQGYLPQDGSLREAVHQVSGSLMVAALSAGDSLDLALSLPDAHEGDFLTWHYCEALLDEGFVRQLHEDYVALLQQASALITPVLSAIDLPLAARKADDAEFAEVVEEVITVAPTNETSGAVRRDASALWRTVQAVIDLHVKPEDIRTESAPVASPVIAESAVTSAARAVEHGSEAAVLALREDTLSPQQWLIALDERIHGVGVRNTVIAACMQLGLEAGSGLGGKASRTDPERAQRALQALMQRHALLRTSFVWCDEIPSAESVLPMESLDAAKASAIAWPRLHENPAVPWRVSVLSVAGEGAHADLHASAKKWLANGASVALPMFGEGLPWRAELATVSNGDERLAVWRMCFNAAIADQHTAERWLAEWQALYAGEVLSPVATQYADYVGDLWKKAALSSLMPSTEADVFWKETLQRVRPVRWPLATSSIGGALSSTIEAELVQRVRVAATAWQVSMESVFLAAYAALLQRYIGGDSFAIGVEFANRQGAARQSLLGPLSNRLPFVAQMSAGRPSVRHRVEQVDSQWQDMALYQDTPALALLPMLSALRGGAVASAENGANATPLMFGFAYRELPGTAALPLVARGLQLMPMDARQARFGIELRVHCGEWQATEVSLAFQAGFLDSVLAEHWFEQYLHLLSGMVNSADSDLALLSVQSLPDQQEVFDRFNREARSLPTFLPHFSLWWQRQCYGVPNNVAVVGVEGRISYIELDAITNQLARYLQAKGVGVGDRVGLLLPRDPMLLASVLALFKLGAAWIPLHSSWSVELQQQVLAHGEASCVLHDSERSPWQGELPAIEVSYSDDVWQKCSDVPFDEVDDAGLLACILYPTENTALAQGVALSHRNISALVAWGSRLFEHRGALKSALAKELNEEGALFDVFVTLGCGGTVVMIEDLLSKQARERPTTTTAKLLALVNHLTVTPTLASELLRRQWLPGTLRSIALLGEQAPPALCDALRAIPGVEQVWTFHACLENSGIGFVGTGARSSLGVPVDGTQCVILNERAQLTAWGVVGDLYIGGASLCSGYWKEPLQGRFTRNPLTYFPTLGSTLFHTGYRACWFADGRIELVGFSADKDAQDRRQVECLRLEQKMAEVLSEVQGVYTATTNACTVFVCGTHPARHYQQLLQRSLPQLNGVAVKVLAEWPRDRLQRIDRATLLQLLESSSANDDEIAVSASESAESAASRVHSGHSNTLERQMLHFWQEWLGAGVTGVDCEFANAGGDSMLALRMVVALAQRYALKEIPPVALLFQHSTPARLALWLDSSLRGEEHRERLWLPLQARTTSSSVLCFRTGDTSVAEAIWQPFAEALPEHLGAWHLCSRQEVATGCIPSDLALLTQEHLTQKNGVHENAGPNGVLVDHALLAKRYVDAMEQECLPVPSAIVGHQEGALLATAVAAELRSRGWAWLPLVLLDGCPSPVDVPTVQSSALHLLNAEAELPLREGWPERLQGNVQWRISQDSGANAVFRQAARWLEECC